MTNSAIAAMKTRSSMVPALLRLKVRIECHDDSQDQQILCWCQANYTRRNFSTPEKARPGPAGIVDPVLQSYNRHSLPTWYSSAVVTRSVFHSAMLSHKNRQNSNPVSDWWGPKKTVSLRVVWPLTLYAICAPELGA